MRERLINRRQQGDLGEVSAIEWLTRQGATVSMPLGHSPDYDLVAEIDGKVFTVQVKTSVFTEPTADGSDRWPVNICTNGGNQSWTGTAKLFDPSRVDYLFVLVGDGRRWFIPTASLEAERAINLGGVKYSEYEIAVAPPIASLVYAETGTPTTIGRCPGVYPSGQRTAPVKRQAYAFAGSNPAAPTDDGARPVAERKLGRAGQAIIRDKRLMTMPVKPFNEANLAIGDRLRFRADGPGRVVIERIDTPST